MRAFVTPLPFPSKSKRLHCHAATTSARARRGPTCCRDDGTSATSDQRLAAVLSALALSGLVAPVMPIIGPRFSTVQRAAVYVAGSGAFAASLYVSGVGRRRPRSPGDVPPAVGSEVLVVERGVTGDEFLGLEHDDEDEDDEDAASTNNKDDRTNPPNVSAFSGSRAEWDDPDVDNTSKNLPPTAADVDATVPSVTEDVASSSVYSYSYRTAKQKRPVVDKVAEPKVQGDKPKTQDVFTHMRSEFDAPEDGFRPSDSSANVNRNRNTGEGWSEPEPQYREVEVVSDHPVDLAGPGRNGSGGMKAPLSGAQIMRRVVGVPMFLFKEVAIPATEVLSVLWYDVKVRATDLVEGRHGFFLSEEEAAVLEDADDWARFSRRRRPGFEDVDSEFDEELLSHEERQILQVERAAVFAVGKMQSSLRNFARLFSDTF